MGNFTANLSRRLRQGGSTAGPVVTDRRVAQQRAGMVRDERGHFPDKGKLGGSCNREACQAPGATWFNHGASKYYCESCARMLNTANRRDEYVRRLGHDLCTSWTPKEEAHGVS